MSEYCNDKPYRYFKYETPEPGEEVVISGIAGRFPKSDNVEHLKENIFNRVDCITSDNLRWQLDHPEIPKRHGIVNNIEKFDASFFNIDYKQAHTMDPMSRILLEHTYEAIVDAGVNPKDLRGKRVSVIIGSCFSESEKTWFYEKINVNGYGIIGCSRSMLANKISRWLGVSGQSYTVDTACSSSLYAMDHAYRTIVSGQCDYAIVGGSNLCLHPFVSLQFSRLGVLSADGICRSFDKDANGYVRSETIAVTFLQRAKNAKRIYATLCHAKTNCDGYKSEGIAFPSSELQGTLLKEFYEECGIPTEDVNYIEAHGTGTRVGDPEELNAIDRVFCQNRTSPVKVGSIKPNIGHTEPASGVCSVAKAIIILETGVIPPNINLSHLREDVKCFSENRISIVTEPTPLEGTYVGINSFGFGGANAHVLLQSHPKTQKKALSYDGLPRLVAVSGRTEEAVATLLDEIDNKPINIEFIGLLHDLHREEILGHSYRGYTIAGLKTSNKNIRKIEKYSDIKRSICFVFSGLGSEWPGMGQALMRFPVFTKAIEKCDAVLKLRKLNIYDILTKKDNSIFDNVLHSSVGIAAVQIGLVDLLTTVGVIPDYIIGHSIGELGCAYADKSLTAEEVILAAYSRGVALIQTKIPPGSMALVEINCEHVKQLCPADIDVAAHNGPDSSIISGPIESMKVFIKKLQANKISVKEVSCGNVPYHSRYIVPAGPRFLSYLKEVIPVAKPRSEKWLSTSVPRNEWSSSIARLSSAEYHTNSLLTPVLFKETSDLIPDNAVTIEIAPHALLSAILNKSLKPTVTNIALTQKDHKDNVEVFLQGLGELYNIGLPIDVAKLYPPIQFPVSRGTPMISHLVRWNHSKDWYVTCFQIQEKIVSGERMVEVSLKDEDWEFVSGHVIDGRNLYPATGYLFIVWETLGMMIGELFSELSVVFEDVKFIRATNIPKEGTLKMVVMIQKGTGNFEVVEGNNTIVTGNVRIPNDISKEKTSTDILDKYVNNEEELLDIKDIYKEFRLRGYQYSGLFRSFRSATVNGHKGHIEWKKNWVAFMDNIMQSKIISLDTRGLFVPTGIKKLVIDSKYHQELIRNLPIDKKYIPVQYYEDLNLVVSGGVELYTLLATAISRRRPIGEPVIEEYKFIAHRDKEEMSLCDILTFSMHISLENLLTTRVKTIEYIGDEDNISADNLASTLISDILGNLPLFQSNINICASPKKFIKGDIPENIIVTDLKKLKTDITAILAIGYNLLSEENTEKLEEIMKITKPNSFILSRENTNVTLDLSILEKLQLGIVAEKHNSKESYILLRKLKDKAERFLTVEINSNEFNWLEKLKIFVEEEMDKDKYLRVILVEEGNFESGLLGFINCLQKEPGYEIFRAVLIQDPKAPKFSLDLPLYSEQINLDLTINVLRTGNVWGSYRHFLLSPLKEKMAHHGVITQFVRGDLSSLNWVEGQITTDDKDIVEIHYAALNFKDVMLASGKLSSEVISINRKELDYLLGFEYSGINSKGERLMGFSNRCLSNLTKQLLLSSWKVPDNWSLEEAATVPCVYSTCICALYMSGSVQKGDKILIHSGTGGIGQAAINLALHEGCEIFVTVGTQEKRLFIRETFPSIDESHIGNSRDTSFEQMIFQETNGRGVDIIINSLAEEKLQASLRCLAPGGRFLEIGKFDIVADSKIENHLFKNQIEFHSVMLDTMMGVPEFEIKLQTLLNEMIKNGAVKPIIRSIFQKDQVEEAIRYMAAGKHIGKVLIQMRKETDPRNMSLATVPTYTCIPNKSYIVVGGLGGFGLELIDWLILRNAYNIVITSRNGIKNGYQQMRINTWKSYGINIKILVNLDAAKREDCEIIVKTAIDLGPVDGIFNLAISLKDSIFINQTVETFEESFKGKAWATKRFDEISRKLCPNLRHFVVFSSVSCGRGNAGQTNYGMANSVMERICEKRVEEGLPGLAIQWGAIGDVGIVADSLDNDKEIVIGGTLMQKISSCFKELNGFLMQNKPVVASMVVAEKRVGLYGASNCVDCVLNIMGIKDLKTISPQTSLAELGMDSMMAVEIKQTLEREFEIFLTPQDIRSLSFGKLIELNNKDENKNKNKEDESIETFIFAKILLDIFGENPNTDVIVPLSTTPEEGQKEIFFIPGIEGYAVVFNKLSLTIKSPAICFQLSSNDELLTIQDMANFFLPHLLERLKDQEDFTIVGYSFGSIIAVELARQLELKGYIGQLVLLDGTPLQMKAMFKQLIYWSTIDELQDNILLNFMETLDRKNAEKLANELPKSKSWEEKINLFIENLSPEYIKMYGSQQSKKAINSYYIRLKALQEYNLDSSPFLKSAIRLVKPTNSVGYNVPVDYGLSNITEGKTEISVAEGNHITMLENVEVTKAINNKF